MNMTTKLAGALRDALDTIDACGAVNMKQARAILAAYDAAPEDAANATPAGEVPGAAGQWLPAARCAQLAPLLHKLLDESADAMPSALWDANDTLALRILADDMEQGAAP